MSKTINKNPCIICVAITGSVPTKKNNPNIPISVNEQIESTQQAFEAGASIVHCHVRNDDGSVSSDPIKFKDLSSDKEFFKIYEDEMKKLKSLENDWTIKNEELEKLI